MRSQLTLAASMMIFGTIGIFVKNIPLSSGEIALFRAMIAATSIAIFQWISGKRSPLSAFRREIPLLFLSGAAIGLNWMLLFEAYRYTTVSVATLCYYFAPVIVTALCPLLFKERLTLMRLVCFALSTVGLLLVVGADGDGGGSNQLVGILLGLGAAVLYSAVILINKSLQTVGNIDRTLWQFIAAIVVLAPYVAMTSGIHPLAAGGFGLLNLLVLGVCHTGITYCLYFSSLKNMPGQEAALLSYLDPLVAVFVSVVILGETLTPMQGFGGSLILGFTLLNELWSMRSRRLPTHVKEPSNPI
ncbi:MAG: DMT family transporter [Oscillospiraceae bacterium]